MLLALLLAGCGTQPTATRPAERTAPAPSPTVRVTRTTPAATAATAATQPVRNILIEPGELDGVQVVFWHPWSGAMGEALEQAVLAFNRENEYGIKAESVFQGNYNELFAQVRAALAEGDPPGLTVAPIYEIAAWQMEGSAVVDLQPYVEDARWGFSPADQADFFPVFWDQDLVEEQRLGLPAQRSGQVLLYNSSWAEELGFSAPPETPEEFKEQACAAAQANRLDGDTSNDATGGWAINTAPSAFLPWLSSFGANVLDPSGAGYRFNTPQTEAALAFLKELYDAGCAWETPTEYAGVEFAGRKAIFVTGAVADLPHINAELERADNPDEWTVLPFPSPRRQPAIGVYGPSFVLLEGTPEEQLAAWLLATWLASPEQQAGFVEAGSSFPTRESALARLDEFAAGHPQWAAAQSLLEYAQTEPAYPSWDTVRWVIGDVGTQVFRYYFTADRIPATLKLMDETAAELHARSGE